MLSNDQDISEHMFVRFSQELVTIPMNAMKWNGNPEIGVI